MSIIADGSKPSKVSISEVGLSTKPVRSQEKFTEASTITGAVGNLLYPTQSGSGLGGRAVVLIEFPGIRLLTKLEKCLHLLLHEVSAAFLT